MLDNFLVKFSCRYISFFTWSYHTSVHRKGRNISHRETNLLWNKVSCTQFSREAIAKERYKYLEQSFCRSTHFTLVSVSSLVGSDYWKLWIKINILHKEAQRAKLCIQQNDRVTFKASNHIWFWSASQHWNILKALSQSSLISLGET